MDIEIALLTIKNGNEIIVYKKVSELLDGSLYITQYERNKETKQLLSLGIKLNNISENKNYIVSIGNSNNKVDLKYDYKTSYFYDDYSESEDAIGISKAGFFIVTVSNLTGEVIYSSKPILVKPSIVSEEMYKDMISMLLNINKELAIDDSSSIYLNGKNKDLQLANKISELLRDIDTPLYNINLNPNVALVKDVEKIRFEKIKKINKKILIDKQIYSFRDKFSSEVSIEVTDTYENRAIYSYLFNIKIIIEFNIESTKKLVKKISKEMIDIDNIIESFTKKIIPSRINNNYTVKLKEKKHKLGEVISTLNSQAIAFEVNLSVLNRYLNFNIFKQYRNKKVRFENLKLTQVFLHETWYKRIYIKFKNFYENHNYELSTLEDEELNIKEVYDIFEIWTFFKMIKTLTKDQRWQLVNGRYLIENINKYIGKYGSLYGYKVDLTHALSNGEEALMQILYNKTLHLENENLRPDFTFIITCKGCEKTFYLDAKYHNYFENTQQHIKDINETAIKKYYSPLLKTKYESSGSFIVHCIESDKFVNFGVWEKIRHRFGIFSITNENSNNFITWISLIMEWIYDEYDICWSCGSTSVNEEEEMTRGNKPKYHYTCNDCGSFWVKSHCTCGKSDKLIKHDLPYKQYHKLTSEKWMVHCPICGDSGLESNKKTTRSIERITRDRIVCDRCNGIGKLGVYRHRDNGICYKCDGSGHI